MSLEHRFLEYAEAFEQSLIDNDWLRLAQYFTENAVYDSGDGDPAQGREAVLAKFESAVDGLDRLMDKRVLDFTPPLTEDDTVNIEWTARYSKAGVPDLEVGGMEFARFEGQRIAHLRDEFKPGAMNSFVEWMAVHGEKLAG